MRREWRECFPRQRLQRKPLDSYTGMHHGTYVTAIWQEAHWLSSHIDTMHVSWCMPGSITHNGGNTLPAFPAHAQSPNLTDPARGPWLKSLWFRLSQSSILVQVEFLGDISCVLLPLPSCIHNGCVSTNVYLPRCLSLNISGSQYSLSLSFFLLWETLR